MFDLFYFFKKLSGDPIYIWSQLQNNCSLFVACHIVVHIVKEMYNLQKMSAQNAKWGAWNKPQHGV